MCDLSKLGIYYRFDINADMLESFVEMKDEFLNISHTICFNIVTNSNYDEYNQSFLLFAMNHFDPYFTNPKYLFSMLINGLKQYTLIIFSILKDSKFLTDVCMKYINPTPSIRGRLNEQALSEVTHYVAKLFTKILSTNDQKDICEDLFNSIIPENVFKGIQDNVNSEVTKAALYKLLYKLFDPYRDWLVPALVDQELPKQIIKDSFEGSHRVKVASLRIMKKVLEYGDLEFLSEFIQPSLLCNIIDSIDPGEDDTTTECLDCLINIMKTVIVNHWKHVAQFFNNVDITNLIDDCIESEYNAVKEKAFKLKGEIAAAFYSMSIEESALEE